MKLYFQNANGKERLVAEVNDADEAYEKIKEFCDERGFKLHYTRQWKADDGRTQIDCGSWCEFFYLDEND